MQVFRQGAQSNIIPAAPPGLLFQGDPGISSSMATLDKNNLAPRLGLAIDVFGNGRTAIRAGYGVFYATPYADSATYLQQQPFQVDLTVFGTPNLTNPYGGLTNPFPYTFDRSKPFFVYPITADSLAANIATPYVEQYSFAIQQQLVRNLSLQVAYVGNQSHKLIEQLDLNQPIFIPGKSTASNINARRPILPGTYGQISESQSIANAHYDSLQVSLDRRFAQGFTILANYTFGKSIDISSDDPSSPTDILVVDSRNLRYDRAPSNFDIRHIVNVSYLWELPSVARWGFVGSKILSGWQVNGRTRLQSGGSVNILAGQDVNLNGINNDRPNATGNVALGSGRTLDQKITMYFNTAAFSAPAAGSLGTAGRNLIKGPGSEQWDASLFKIVRIGERQRVTFRAEVFNFPNRVNLGNPNSTLSSSSFGRILTAGSARVVQLGLKYSF